ncbi:MAG: GLUG motif-containing protein, partial [Prevotella sp.]
CLFGRVEGATIKDLTIKDSYLFFGLSSHTPEVSQASFVVGSAYKSNISNCHVVNCVADFTGYFFHIGGIVGEGENCTVTNCTFNGTINIHAKTADTYHYKSSVGGILGYFEEGTIKNCHSRGTIKITERARPRIGGFGGSVLDINVSDCTTRMNLISDNLKEGYLTDPYYFGGFTGYFNNSTFNRCASLGNISIGNDSADITLTKTLYISGFGNGEGTAKFYDCVRSGKITFNGKVASPHTSINGFTFGFDDLEIVAQRCVAYNDIDFGTDLVVHGTPVAGTVYKRSFNPMFGYLDEDEDQDFKDTKDIYYTYVKTGDNINGTKNYGEEKDLSYLKGELCTYLKNDILSPKWGTYASDDENQNGLPLPVTCGGNITDFVGSGTEAAPYIITTEAELRALQSSIENGSVTQNIYYRLDADINMLADPMPPIGSSTAHPFEGIFDGHGHSINDIVLEKGYLFGCLGGTVKNLTLAGVRQADYSTTLLYPLAYRVGYTITNEEEVSQKTPGYINNCYVNADLYIYRSPNNADKDIRVSGICGFVENASIVKDCYFKGSINASSQPVSGETTLDNPYLYASGISINVDSDASQYNCYASYSYKTTGDFAANNNKGTISYYSPENNNKVNFNYFVCANVENENTDDSGIKKLSKDSELTAENMNQHEDDPQWLQGMYRPVVRGSKYYTVTTPDGGTAYLDIVPESNPKASYIVNITPDEDIYSDKHIWQLPNVAIYVQAENTDYIVDGRLDQSSDFNYKANANASTTVGQLYYSLTQTSTGYHMICLPGVVDNDDLPEGSKVMICGKVTKDSEDKETINIILADSIPAGVPCILYIPTSEVVAGNNVNIVMRSGIVSSSRLVDSNSSLTGTFAKTTVSDYCNTATVDEGTGTVTFKRSTEATDMLPFTAWITGATGDVTVVDYLLLDEDNNYITKTLKDYNSTEESLKTTNIKLHRTLKSGQWNTVCLPFDMTTDEIASVFGSETKVEQFNSCSYDAATSSYTLQFKTSSEGIKAGVPYLVKPSSPEMSNIYDLKDRNISCTDDVPEGNTQDTGSGYSVTYQGSYNKRTIGEDEYGSTEIYIISGNKIYHVNSEVLMKGFRCYFTCSGTGSSSAPSFGNASIGHDDGTTTALELIETGSPDDTEVNIYDIAGRRLNAPQKGIMIVGGKKRAVK